MKTFFKNYKSTEKSLRGFYSISKGLFCCFYVLLVSSCSNFSQKIDASPNLKYFEKFLSSEAHYDVLKNSFPTLEECKLVFKEKHATTYFNWLNGIKNEYFNSGKSQSFLTDFGRIQYVYTEDEENVINSGEKIFKSVRYDSISTSEFKEEWKTYYQPSVNIYNIVFLNEMNDLEGFEYNGFVSINNQWKFFPKPKRSLFNN